MPRWRRANLALIAILAVAAVAWFWLRCPSDPGTILNVQCTHERGSMSATAWILQLDGQGNGNLSIRGRRYVISSPQGIAQLQAVLPECRICDIPSDMGFDDVDHKVDRLRITTTTLDKSFTVQTVPRDEMDVNYHRFERMWKIVEECVAMAVKEN